MIKNILAFVFSAVLIDFDQKFIAGTLDFGYGYYIPGCTVTASSDTINGLRSVMVSLAKGQLAASVIMLVSALTFIGIYIYVYIRSITEDRRDWNNGVSNNQGRIPVPQPPMFNPQPAKPAPGPGSLNPTIVCPNCGATVFTNDRF